LEAAVKGLDYLEWPVPSRSRPGVSHHVRFWLRDWRGFKANTLSCDCERWIYQKLPLNEKHCHHTDEIAERRLRQTPMVADVEGSEVTFDENLIASKGISRLEALKRELETL